MLFFIALKYSQIHIMSRFRLSLTKGILPYYKLQTTNIYVLQMHVLVLSQHIIWHDMLFIFRF